MRTTIIVVDDFYDEPMKIRELALKENYIAKGTYPGADAPAKNESNFTRWHSDRFSKILGGTVLPSYNSGNFRLSLEGDEADRHIHVDNTGFIANISLTLDQDMMGGLALWKHKDTGMDLMPTSHSGLITLQQKLGYSIESLVLKDGQDESKWDQIMLIPYRFNRCIIISGHQFHSPWPQGFGDNPENGRLSQHFFFELV